MIRTFSAHTQEIDDTETAVAEVLSGLDLDALGSHSVGLLTCYAEFIDTGVVAAVCQALPFDVVGCTTIGCAVPGRLGQLTLTLTVLTSDDVHFAAVATRPLTDGPDEPIRDACRTAADALGTTPAMAIAYVPLLFQLSGDLVLDKLNDALDGLPVFGTLACDHTSDFTESCIIFNGEALRESLGLVFIGGDVSPAFFVASVDDSKTLKQKAVITASKDNLLISVNNMPALAYFESLGLIQASNVEGLKAIPFLIDYNDGTKPVTRNPIGLTEEGHLVFGGSIPPNATLGIGSIDHDDVLATARGAIGQALATGRHSLLLIFSCMGRNFTLNFDSLAEMQAVTDTAGDGIPFQFTYSGGEICPLPREDGSLVNRFHNDTIIVCAL